MATDPSRELISFGDFRLDRRARELRYRGKLRRLRAKSSALLLFLAEHPDRLITREELLKAVWPDTAVSGTVLRVCVREIRVALGRDAGRFLSTVRGRGYRFTLEADAPQGAAAVFVGREDEKAVLHEALAECRGGRRSIVFVSGASGVGKTALLEHFFDEVRAAGAARCARGQVPEPNHPSGSLAVYFELLGRLCEESASAEVVDTLTRVAPQWLPQSERGNSAGEQASRHDLRRVLEQLASKKPLIIAVEDLHWSDPATLEALCFLAQPSDATPLLIIGTYRPDSLDANQSLRETLGKHAASKTVHLGPLSAEDTASYLGHRLAPHSFGDDITTAIQEHSAGNPQRLVAIVDQSLEAEKIALRDEVWQLEGSLPEIAAAPEPARAPASARPPRTPSAAGERRQLTVMCCDLGSSIDLAQRLDPEDLHSVVSACQDAVCDVIQNYDGHVAQFLADGLVAYFGYPQAHEYDAPRAVRAGLDVLEALNGLKRRMRKQYDLEISSRIGIHTGTVVIGASPRGERGEQLALGGVPHVASLVRDAAMSDQLVVSQATNELVRGMFVTEELDTPLLAGNDQAMSLSRVVSPTGVRGRLSAAAGHPTPLIGRQDQLASLAEQWRAASHGEGRAVLLRGEAGIGKSRLVHELRRQLSPEDHAWFESGATPYTAESSFYPVIELVAQALDLSSEDTRKTARKKLDDGLGELASPENTDLVASLLDLPAPTVARLSPELVRQNTIALLTNWALTLGNARPAVLVVEDLHWCDPSTLQLLATLATKCQEAPLLILTTARTDFEATWDAAALGATIELDRLSESETRAMAVSVADDDLPPHTIQALAARSDGVPLYVEELTKSVNETTQVSGVDAIPTTVADSLMARIDRLGTAKKVAQQAAAIGREFDYPLLAAASDIDGDSLQESLQTLADAGIVFARGQGTDASFMFKHALVQETAYRSLLKGARQEQHARIGEALEERFPEIAQRRGEWVAWHYDQAGLAAKAIEHYRLAGERAALRCANEEAIELLRRAIALSEQLPDRQFRRKTELELLMASAAPMSAARGWSNPEYEALFARARELAGQMSASGELARVTEGMAAAYLMKGDVRTSTEIAQDVLVAAERSGNSFDLMIGHVCLGTPLMFRGHFAAASENLDQAMALYDPTDDPAFGYMVGFDRGIAAHAYAGLCSVYLGLPDRAEALGRHAITLARDLDHPLTLANALQQYATVLWERRDCEKMLAPIDEAIDISQSHGFPFWALGASFFRGAARSELGEIESGLAEMQESFAGLAQLGNGLGAPAGMFVLGHALHRAGRIDEALGVLDLGAAQAEVEDQHLADAEILRTRAKIALETAPTEPGKAEELMRRALDVAERQGARTFALRAAVGLARIWRDQGNAEAARELVAPRYALFTEGAGTPDLLQAEELLRNLGATRAEAH